MGNPTSIVSQELMEKTGIYFPRAHLDPKLMAELAAAGHEILGFDSIMPEFSVQQEAAALGCEMDWGSPSMMPDARTHPFQRVEDLILPENLLEKPSLKVVLEALTLLRREYGDRVAIVGKVMGPWTISYHMAGTQNFLLWAITDPDKVRRFLDVLKEVTVLFARAQFKAGADVVVAGSAVFHTKDYRETIARFKKEMDNC